MNLQDVIEFLNQLITALASNPYILIFAVCLILGKVMKAYCPETMPKWVIPATVSVIGLVAGVCLTSLAVVPAAAEKALKWPQYFQSGFMGLFFGLASIGAHQLVTRWTDSAKEKLNVKNDVEEMKSESPVKPA